MRCAINQVMELVTRMSLVANSAEDSAASYAAPIFDVGTVHSHPMREARLQRHIVVDANLSSHLDPGSFACDGGTTSAVSISASTSSANTTSSNRGHDSPLPAQPLPQGFAAEGS